ncbi:hypothetical protein E2C01_035840 [Portunus trituberculatus]|uniref:Uncharacterized protein n=1 Tax=Portunus trituberculatus TaxID=210409 RepID=A0A5B7FCJ4_PORTR|nr:hypothetical protein [Portunus trituberculatus]
MLVFRAPAGEATITHQTPQASYSRLPQPRRRSLPLPLPRLPLGTERGGEVKRAAMRTWAEMRGSGSGREELAEDRPLPTVLKPPLPPTDPHPRTHTKWRSGRREAASQSTLSAESRFFLVPP